MFSWLRIAALAAALWAAAGLIILALRARRFGPRVLYAAPGGDPGAGVRYLFGPGLSPLAKESARDHLGVYFTGTAYHAGIFASFAHLVLVLAGVRAIPPLLLWVLLAGSLAGAAAGLVLLMRRAASPILRALTCPDDVVANLLTTLFCAASFLQAAADRAPGALPSGPLAPLFLGSAALVLLYVPVGKIRHCVFFFLTRIHAGAFFGRRGVLPPVRSGFAGISPASKGGRP